VTDEILAVEGLHKHFTSGVSVTDRLFGKKPVVNRAVDDVHLVLHKGETLGLVGESGCGKSTLARTIVGLYRPDAGIVRYAGAVLPARRTGIQHRSIQMVFQDPYSSLNPRMTVGQTLGELLHYHKLVPRNKVGDRCRELMSLVGLPDSALGQRPRQFSGGQRQRIGIARALAVEPTVLIADEPVSAICDRTAVMYLGRIVETGVTDAVFDQPVHPYTQLLLKSVPRLGVPAAPADEAEGATIDVPADAHPCRFLDRCPAAVPACAVEPALLADPADPQRAAACVHVPWPAGTIEEMA
jgi:oligopeptide/dipeptide ABC transporter ATP-binding protein